MSEGSASSSGAGLLWRALLVRARFVLLLGAVVAVAAFWSPVRDRIGRARRSAEAAGAAAQFYCPMHPAVVRATADTCPSCGMALSRRATFADGADDPGAPRRITLAPWRIAQAGIRTEEVAWRPLVAAVEGTGTLRFDESRVRRIGAGFVGRVTSVERSFDGATVRKGEPILRLVGPDLQATLQSYATATKQLRDAEGRSATAAIERLRGQTDALRRQLLQWGFDAEQLDGEAPTAGDDTPLRAPFDCVVLHVEVAAGQQVAPGTPLVHLADPSLLVAEIHVARADAGFLAVGRVVEFRDPFDPAVVAEGRVAHVSDVVSEETQAVTARVAVEKRDPRLRPGSAVLARIRVPLVEVEPWRSLPRPAGGAARTVFVCPMHDLVKDAPGICERCGGMELLRREVPTGPLPGDVLSVSAAAVIETGAARIVYVETEPGVFTAREVKLGREVAGHRPVLAGITAGERIVSAGSFLLDAEARLDPAIGATYFGAASAETHAGDAPGEAKSTR